MSILMSRENPSGLTLESVLTQLIEEIEQKTKRIASDTSDTADKLRAGNDSIIDHLKSARRIQLASMKLLDSVGPNQGPTGVPRLGRQFIIVKGAAPTIWPHYFDDDPQKGVHSAHNAAYTPSGLGLPLTPFNSREEAAPWLQNILLLNPSGYYDVCPLLRNEVSGCST